MPPKQPTPPTHPAYQSGPRIKNLLSFAASTTFNPRGLESRYYPCYATTFEELFRPISDDFHTSTQMTISVPGEMVQDVIQEKDHRYLGEELKRERSLIETTPDPVGPTSSQRSSLRLFDKLLNKHLELHVAHKTKERAWQQEELARMVRTEDPPQDFTPKTSFDRPTRPDNEAKDGIPDLLVEYIRGEVLEQPVLEDVSKKQPDLDQKAQREKFEDMQYRHKLRAGTKIAGYSLVLIGEIKPLTLKHKSETPAFNSTYFMEAVNEVMVYCAIHFQAHLESGPVFALVGMGPYWQGHVFAGDSVPTLDLKTGEVDGSIKANKLKAKRFVETFSDQEEDCHFLGSASSDVELESIRYHVSKQYLATPPW